jgi:uncharacterized membrane protein YhaH (DUF805 family)
MSWYLKVLKNYAVFEGRARRREYWMFTLISFLIAIGAMIIDNILGTTIQDLPYGLFYALYSLAVFIPGLAVLVRRLHDTDRSGWWFFIALVPLIGGIWLFVLTVLEGTRGSNGYGADPKASREWANR